MILDLFKLDGRIAVVTGGRRGLGQAMAAALAQAGADIACVSKTGQADATRQVVERAGRRFLDLKVDLAQPEQRRGLIERIAKELGRVDILVNNAGNSTRHPPEVYPEADWRELLETHLHATFDLSQQAAPGMFARGRGKIINVGSVMSFEGGLNIPAYAAAKHGIAGLTKTVALELAEHGVTANAICPGYVLTQLVRKQIPDQAKARGISEEAVMKDVLLAAQPTKEFVEVSQIAALAAFLCSDEAAQITGALLPIDGGWTAH